MGLAALDAALSGLRISQQQISVISNNVANIGTPGFTRKILPQTTQAIDGVSVGVSPATIIRQVDLNLERDLWTQVSKVGFLDVRQSYLERIEKFHGPPDAELSIAAEIARLKDAFSILASSPEDSFSQANVVNLAVDTADKFNDLSNLITTLRNDIQSDIQIAVGRVNDLLLQVAELNEQVVQNLNVNRSIALIQDQRDEAIKELSEIIDISFFVRGDGVLVLQTNQGVELAATQATSLVFTPDSVSSSSYYPVTISGLFVGDPATNPAAVDITTLTPGGKLGGLLDLRDNIFPKQMAQLDELAHKMALRFEMQGLQLFTDSSGNIPADTPPDPTTLPNPTPVTYVGFSADIQVSAAVLADNSLLQQGTVPTDIAIPTGSNEVINRVLENVFGDINFQQAAGAIDIRVGGAATDLQAWLGVFSENTITTTRDIQSVGDLVAAPGSPFSPAGADTFSITIDPAGEGPGPLGPFNININALPAPRGAAELAAAITAIDPSITAIVNTNGQLEISSRWDITIADVNMGTPGFQFLGIVPGTYNATDPYFDIQVGNNPSTRITINPGDTQADLIDKLILNAAGDAFNPVGDTTGIAGLAFDDVTLAATGSLILRPGDDFANPNFGGSINISSGPFTVDAANAEINVLTPGTLTNGINLVSALFGSFSSGPPIQNFSPVSSVGYQSQTNGSLAPPIPTLPFRTDLLGPGANISTQVIGAANLLDFAQKMVNEQTQELILTNERITDEETLKETLQRLFLDESSVNLDEELGNLIIVQNAFSASARVITAVDELFEELLAVL